MWIDSYSTNPSLRLQEQFIRSPLPVPTGVEVVTSQRSGVDPPYGRFFLRNWKQIDEDLFNWVRGRKKKIAANVDTDWPSSVSQLKFFPWDAGITKWIGHHKLSIKITKDSWIQLTKSCLIPSPFVCCPWLPLGTAQVDEELAELREWTGLLHGREDSAGGPDPRVREVYLKVCSMWFLEAGWRYKYTSDLQEIIQWC